MEELRPRDRRFSLDDLERSSVNPLDLMGVVNRYVEHHGCRVVVIAHDGRLSDGLKGQKEKVFGQVIRAKPDIAAAFEAFKVEFCTAGIDVWLDGLRGDIFTAFNESQVESLRILRHVVEDLVRLWEAVSPVHREQLIALNELALLFAAWSFERRAERITRGDLASRTSIRFTHALGARRDESVETPPAIAAMNRYSMAPMESQVVPDDLLQRLLFDSIFDAQEIQAALNQSAYFASPQTLPSWRVFMDFGRRDDAEVEQAMQQMLKEFADRSVQDPGDMLHHFALRMMMSKWRLIEQSLDDVRAECFEYIDHLAAVGMLKPGLASYGDEDLGGGAGGYSYWVEDEAKEQFKSVFDYLRAKRQREMIEQLPNDVPELLTALAADADEFQKLLLHTGDDAEPKFGGKPILTAIDVDAFVQAMLGSHPKNWSKTIKVLQERRRNELQGEDEWCQAVGDALNREAENADGIRKVRITRLANSYLKGR